MRELPAAALASLLVGLLGWLAWGPLMAALGLASRGLVVALLAWRAAAWLAHGALRRVLTKVQGKDAPRAL